MNPKLIASLGIDLPDEQTETSNLPVPEPIHPGDIVRVDNPNLPELEDIETNLIESERQLETLIQTGFQMINDLAAENKQIQPNYRNGHLERLMMLYAHTSDIVKFKAKLQLDKKKARLEEAKFVRGQISNPEGQTIITDNTFITMSQKDILKVIDDAKRAQMDGSPAQSVDLTDDPK